MVSPARRTDPQAQNRIEERQRAQRIEEAKKAKEAKEAKEARARTTRATPAQEATRPAVQPTRDTARTAFARLNADNGTQFRTLQLHQTLDAKRAGGVHAFHHSEPEAVPAHHDVPPTDPTQQTPGVSSAPTRAELDAAMKTANESGDLSALNEVDPFRESLPPHLQERYDRELQRARDEVRSDENPDGRINFVYEDGATRDPATEDLALRGMVAASFGRPDHMEKALDKGAEGDNGALDIHISGAYDLNGDEEGTPIGYAHRDADISMSREGFLQSITGGRNTAMHEMNHVFQLGGEPESNFDDYGILPPDASPEEVDEFTGLFLDAYHPKGGAKENDDTVHYWTTAQNDFRLDPQGMKERSPELYQWMADYTGYDPLAGTVKPTLGEKIGDWLDDVFGWFAPGSSAPGAVGGGGGRAFAS